MEEAIGAVVGHAVDLVPGHGTRGEHDRVLGGDLQLLNPQAELADHEPTLVHNGALGIGAWGRAWGEALEWGQVRGVGLGVGCG